MSKLIVCLGYNLQPDNSIPSILENRLKDTIKLCNENKNSVLLLMGASLYQDSRENIISEALAMKNYLEKNFKQEIKSIKMLTEETSTSTVEQLCYLKKFIKKEKFNYSDVVIISSQFFIDRVKFYAEYIFDTSTGIIFIESAMPQNLVGHFQSVEEGKFKQAQGWLKNHRKRDDQTILIEQKVFQNQVKKGKINQPIS